MANTPKWTLDGDWFDVCKCNIPCPCEFAQTPTFGDCDGILAWHVRKGLYGDVDLDGLSVIALGSFEGNLWAGAKVVMGIFIDERANAAQRARRCRLFSAATLAGGPHSLPRVSRRCAASHSHRSNSTWQVTSPRGERPYLEK
jgi:hypothetical protein